MLRPTRHRWFRLTEHPEQFLLQSLVARFFNDTAKSLFTSAPFVQVRKLHAAGAKVGAASPSASFSSGKSFLLLPLYGLKRVVFRTRWNVDDFVVCSLCNSALPLKILRFWRWSLWGNRRECVAFTNRSSVVMIVVPRPCKKTLTGLQLVQAAVRAHHQSECGSLFFSLTNS